MKAPKQRPDPKLIIEAQKLKLERDKLNFEMMKFQYELPELHSKIMKNIADAESKEAGQQIEIYKEQMKYLVENSKLMMQREANAINKPAGDGGVAASSGNEGSVS